MSKNILKILNSIILIFGAMFFLACQSDSNSNKEREANSKMASEDLIVQNAFLKLLDQEKFFSEATALGTERATTNELQEFSKSANEVHLKNYEKLKAICEEKGYTIPDKLSEKYNDKLYLLVVTNSKDFDGVYKKSVISDYEVSIDSLAKIINDVSYPKENSVLLEVNSNNTKNLDLLDNIK